MSPTLARILTRILRGFSFLGQKALAERMNCTQQYVSKILKGRENMPLDTLSKVEDALSINLINDEQTTYPTMVAEEEFV